MNVTTGGPNILLFERDQQLAALLTSELQLAGFECHVARTAVEVFDAIARFPIRLLLVNLAQAAASRREFWVALDTQRRGRGVQVLTFLCMNVAGYGPKDPDDVPQSITIDIEVDGMIGLMNLVEAVRTRLPSATPSAPAMPQVSNTPVSPPSFSASPGPSVPPSTGNAGEALFRSIPPSNAPSYQSVILPGIPPTGSQPGAAMNFTTISQQAPPGSIPPTQVQSSNGVNQAVYTDRIRAVLYPNQRSWSANSPLPPETQHPQENQIQQGLTMNAPRQEPMPPYAQPQNGMDLNNRTTSESGLDQLTRLIQQYQSAAAGVQVPLQQPPMAPPSFSGSSAQQFAPPLNGSQTNLPQQPMRSSQPLSGNLPQYGVTPRPAVAPTNVTINAQLMRAAPIQDLPSERQLGPESQRGTEMPLRSGGSIQPISGSVPPLASMTTPQMPPIQASPMRDPVGRSRSGELRDEEPMPTQTLRGNTQRSPHDQETIVPLKKPLRGERQLERTDSQEETLINMIENLPPMPPSAAAQSQAAQSYVLNGRAIRSLGSVLVTGHLVPEDRLEVAQNIQRMLRGVDLNYQLG
ncbi:MAG TPA: hypothetical protein VH593_08355, partial [Ktedonobacteraceae bacterium]